MGERTGPWRTSSRADTRSWTFDLDPDGRDPVLGYERLQQAYFARFPDHPKGITVPAIVDVPTGKVVTNDFAQITLDLSTEWTDHHRPGAIDLYPEALRPEMDELMHFVDTEVSVYRCGFSASQAEYEAAYHRLFNALDVLSERLAGQRSLMGEAITEADVRLFTTLARFDAVYHVGLAHRPRTRLSRAAPGAELTELIARQRPSLVGCSRPRRSRWK